MGYPVTYYCPRCGTVVELERDGYLADKSVTPYPLEGWSYVSPAAPFEDDADGVRFVCGESDGVVWRSGPEADDGSADQQRSIGCGEPFYLSFVRFEEGREVDPRPEVESVEINTDPRPPGPRGPSGPGSGSGGFR